MSSVEVSRASHCHQTPHAFRAQSGPVTSTIRPKTTVSSAAAAASRSAPGRALEQVDRARDAADERREEHHHRRRHVVVEDLLHQPHRRLDGRPRDDRRRGGEQHHRHQRQHRVHLGSSVAAPVTPSSAARTSRATASRTRCRRRPAAPSTCRARSTVGTGSNSAAVPRTPAMMTGIVIGYSRIGSMHVAAPRAHEHGREQRADGGEPDRPSRQQRQQRERPVARAARGTAGRPAARGPPRPRASSSDDAEQLARRRCAGRLAGASISARSVSACRSRSKVRPSASVPAKAIAIHRIPAAASSSGRPSLTSAKANTSTQDTAKNTVV